MQCSGSTVVRNLKLVEVYDTFNVASEPCARRNAVAVSGSFLHTPIETKNRFQHWNIDGTARAIFPKRDGQSTSSNGAPTQTPLQAGHSRTNGDTFQPSTASLDCAAAAATCQAKTPLPRSAVVCSSYSRIQRQCKPCMDPCAGARRRPQSRAVF